MKRLGVIFISIIIAFAAGGALSCTEASPLQKDTFYLEVGELVDIADFVNEAFVLDVDNSSVASTLCGTVLRGEKPGTSLAYVRTATQTHTITINVSYAKDSINILCDSPLFTSVKGCVLTFTAERAFGSDQSAEVIWKVNGSTAGVGNTFALTASDYGKYVVSASANGLSASLTAVCAPKPQAVPAIAVSQAQALQATVFTLANVDDTENLYSRWYLDGKEVGFSEGDTFEYFFDKAGEYSVYAICNGVQTDQVIVTVTGKSWIQNAYIDYDSDFPNVYLRWDGIQDADYEVTVSGTTYDSTNQRFGKNQFDLTSLVDLTKAVEVKLQCNGNDYTLPSDSVTLITPIITNEEKEFLAKKYFDGNYYMTSDQEVFDAVAYAIIFRPNAIKSADEQKLNLSLYMGYDSNLSPATLLALGWSYAEQTGSYSLSANGSAQKGSKIHFDITFYLTDTPDDIEVSHKTTYETLTTPIFEGSSYVLPIEDKPSGGEVETSDELYFVVQKGYKPVPKSGSDAERLYGKAKRVLANIVSQSMTEVQRAQAIYDWIMWQTTYDYEVSRIIDISVAIRQPAYYLEGVFEYGFAVCDGIAKTMSLLCNMVDIPCVRVVGETYGTTVSRHAWNKILIDGKWYIVDATWGDGKVSLSGEVYEGALHAYFLKSEGEMTSHKATYPHLYPTASDSYNWYSTKQTIDGSTDLYVEDSSITELTLAVQFGVENAVYEITYSQDTYERSFYCIELCLSTKAKNYFRGHVDEVNAIISSVISYTSVPWTITGNYMLILLNK